MQKQKSAFTLIELSIVLVIIGLIIGGILVGQELINSAKVRAQISQFEKYASAVMTFKSKYNCLPGDCVVATDFSLGNNGNGNGLLESSTQCGWTTTKTSPDCYFDGELPLFFQHLSTANLVEGNYNGTFTLNVGYPALKLNEGAGMIASGNWGTGAQYSAQTNTMPQGFWLHAIICAPSQSTPSSANDNCALATTQQMYAIDSKLDDGLPTTGIFQGYYPTGFTCRSGNSYVLTQTGLQCQGSYKIY